LTLRELVEQLERQCGVRALDAWSFAEGEAFGRLAEALEGLAAALASVADQPLESFLQQLDRGASGTGRVRNAAVAAAFCLQELRDAVPGGVPVGEGADLVAAVAELLALLGAPR